MYDNISSTALLLELNFIIFWIGENVYLALKSNLNFFTICQIGYFTFFIF